MLDRFGNPIRIGWALHEEEWVRAALTLAPFQQDAAFRDIADLTGRSFTAIQAKASKLALADARAAMTQRVMVPVRFQWISQRARHG